MKIKDAINKLRPEIDDEFRGAVQIIFWMIFGIVSVGTTVMVVAKVWGVFPITVACLFAIWFLGFGTRSKGK